MKYTEELHWILDKEGKRLNDVDEYRQNIEFVHSLGLKCDCVGWSTLKLSDPRADEIFDAIEKFCKENGWKARGLYFRKYIDVESDWYELVPTDIRDSTDAGNTETVSDNGKKLKLPALRAFHELQPGPKFACWDSGILVPERFRNACLKHDIADIDFCWVQDKGKYAAEQYFLLYSSKMIRHILSDKGIDQDGTDRMLAAGGYLPKIGSIFHTMQQINLQMCYPAGDMPAGGIAYAYYAPPYAFIGGYTILIHKDIAQMLLREKALPSNALRPAPVFTEIPGGYVLQETRVKERPTAEYFARMLTEYEKIKSIPRPVHMISEKDALKLLRNAKKQRKSDFHKALPKSCDVGLTDKRYLPLEPYYRVANGGYLSDEYEYQLLPFDHAQKHTLLFAEQMALEELLEKKPNGVVFAKCPDGDWILLRADGSVIRFSHEVPEVIDEWPSLAQFLCHAITEC